MRPVIKIEID